MSIVTATNESNYKLREDVRLAIYSMFRWWERDEVADLCVNIIDEVCENVKEISDYNDSDLRIAIKRTIINLTGIGK